MNRSFITGILLLFLTVCVFGQQPLLNIPFLENMPEIDGMTDGRGTSNCFTDDGAETDVREAIEDVIKNYPVNASEIILAGFSMGGYGAYRIYYEYPAMFKGIAVFPGHPNLATKWLGSGRGDRNALPMPGFRPKPNPITYPGLQARASQPTLSHHLPRTSGRG